MEFTSRQLRALVAIADRGSFSRAADALFMTPSGVSVLVREIESQLGFRVFERTTRQVSLTGHGSALLPAIRRALADIDDAASIASRTASARDQVITIGAAPLIAANLLPPAIKAFRTRRPDVRVRTFDGDSVSVVRRGPGRRRGPRDRRLRGGQRHRARAAVPLLVHLHPLGRRCGGPAQLDDMDGRSIGSADRPAADQLRSSGGSIAS